MPVLGQLALWLTLVLGMWSIVATRSGTALDPRLLASGARALHAASVLMLIASLAALATLRGEAMAATGQAPAGAIVRALLGTWPTYVVVVAGIIATVAAMIPRSRGTVPARDRARALAVGGSCVALGAAAALALRAGMVTPVDEAAVAAELHHWGGVVFHLLYPAGIAASLVPVAIGPVPQLTTTRLRWTLYALATVLAALAAGAWARYAGAAPAPELDAAGVLADRQWTTAQLLLLVPPLLLVAGAHALYARRRAGGAEPARAPVATAVLLLVAGMVIAGIGPAVVDWAAGHEVGFGTPIAPLRGALAVAAAVGLSVAAGYCVVRLRRSRASDGRLLAAAHASALVALALAVVAMSSEVQPLEMGPGTGATLAAAGTTWKATSQGTSQVDGASYDGAVVAFVLEADATQHFATAGERLYRDGHGHNAARVAVPGIVRQPAGDLRFTIRGLRGDAALVRAQFHPLATPAWVMAVATVMMLLAGAATLRPAGQDDGPR